MFFFPAGDEEVEKIVTTLNANKSTGLNCISVKILKPMLPVIFPYLSGLMNSSFSRKNFSNCLKKASVTPLFKQGSKFAAINYRPVSILPVVSIVLKRPMYITLHRFMNKRFN